MHRTFTTGPAPGIHSVEPFSIYGERLLSYLANRRHTTSPAQCTLIRMHCTSRRFPGVSAALRTFCTPTYRGFGTCKTAASFLIILGCSSAIAKSPGNISSSSAIPPQGGRPDIVTAIADVLPPVCPQLQRHLQIRHHGASEYRSFFLARLTESGCTAALLPLSRLSHNRAFDPLSA